ncbi:uncharacterized protein METZ01_LOCUS393869, partial [marine metagenome]
MNNSYNKIMCMKSLHLFVLLIILISSCEKQPTGDKFSITLDISGELEGKTYLVKRD